MVKRKLKGKNAEKINLEKKDKMEKTLARMDKVREEDSINLRNAIEAKIIQHEGELKATEQVIESYNLKKQEATKVKLKLEGAIISLKEILNNDIEK